MLRGKNNLYIALAGKKISMLSAFCEYFGSSKSESPKLKGFLKFKNAWTCHLLNQLFYEISFCQDLTGLVL